MPEWTDDSIREAFIYDGGEAGYYDPINGAKEQRSAMGSVFDRWLQSVKAEAWDEGFDEASDDLGRAQMMHDVGEGLNPYRKEEK